MVGVIIFLQFFVPPQIQIEEKLVYDTIPQELIYEVEVEVPYEVEVEKIVDSTPPSSFGRRKRRSNVKRSNFGRKRRSSHKKRSNFGRKRRSSHKKRSNFGRKRRSSHKKRV